MQLMREKKSLTLQVFNQNHLIEGFKSKLGDSSDHNDGDGILT